MTAKTRTADTSTRTMDMGNNETISQGVFADSDGTVMAMTWSQSKDGFKTRAGAERWLARKLAR